MWFLYIFVILISTGIGFYMYNYIKRAFETFGAPAKHKAVRVILIALSVCFALLCFNISGFGFLITMHIFMFAVITQLINFVLKYFRWNVWNKIYGSGILPIIATVVLLTVGYFTIHNVVATKYRVETDKELRSEGYRVVLIADVHFGVSVDYEELTKKCQEISQQKPSFVILCGDIVDNETSKEEMQQVFKAFGKIQSEFGVFYVYGNHDRPLNMIKSEFTEEELNLAIQGSGITILRDAISQINGEITLIGREDKSFGRTPLKRLTEGVDINQFILTLDHQPNSYEETGDSVTDLVLSGHTHGGQLWPLKQVQEIFNMNDGIYGHMWIDEDTQAIVTSGFAGWAFPVKTAAPAEYVLIDITSDK